MKRLLFLFIMLFVCGDIFAQTTPVGSPNTTTWSKGGFKTDSAMSLPFIPPTKRYGPGKGMDTVQQVFASTTDTLPKFMKMGTVVPIYTAYDTVRTLATQPFVLGEIQKLFDSGSLDIGSLGWGLIRLDTILLVDSSVVASRVWVTSNFLLKADTIYISNRINLKQNFTDTSTYDATKYQVDTAKSAIRGQIPTLIAGTGISIGDGPGAIDTIKNSAPDQVVSFTNIYGLVYGGTYPAFTVRVDTLSGRTPTQYRVDTASQNTRFYAQATFAGLASPAFTGNPTAPTQSARDSSTRLATTAYVDASTQVVVTTNFTTSYTINSTDKRDIEITITAQAGSLLFNNPTGTWLNNQMIIVNVTDNGTGRSITFGNKFLGMNGGSLPTTTVTGRPLTFTVLYNAPLDKYYVSTP